jgi:hypothetical protein
MNPPRGYASFLACGRIERETELAQFIQDDTTVRQINIDLESE